MRVLVIEDDATLGHALQEFLGGQGYAVDWLQSGDRVEGALAGQLRGGRPRRNVQPPRRVRPAPGNEGRVRTRMAVRR